MEVLLPSTQIKLTNKNTYTIRITDEPNETVPSILPRDKDVQSMHLTFPDDLEELRVQIAGKTMARFRKEDDHTQFPIYTSLLHYCHIDLEFVFDDTNWSPVEMTKYNKEIDVTQEIDIYDGCEYHRGHPVTYKLVTYTGKEKTVTRPSITFILAPPTTLVNPKVPVRELVRNIDTEYKVKLEKRHNLTMVSETTGYATNYIYYGGGLAGNQYVF
jgi:hypothetical protein